MDRFLDCYAYLDEGQGLVVGNKLLERVWQLDSGCTQAQGAFIPVPVPISLKNFRSGLEWLEASAPLPMFRVPGMDTSASGGFRLQVRRDDDYGTAPEHMAVELKPEGDFPGWKLVIRIYPGEPLMRQSLFLRRLAAGESRISGIGQDADNCGGHSHTKPHPGEGSQQKVRLAADENSSRELRLPADYVDALPLNLQHCMWKAVELTDATDHYNNLVGESSGLLLFEDRPLSGNFLFLQSNLHKEGLVVVKESPTRQGQLHYPGHDYRIIHQHVYVTGSGIGAGELLGGCAAEEARLPAGYGRRDGMEAGQGLGDDEDEDFVEAYGTAVGVYCGGEYEGLEWVDRYYRCLRRPKPQLDCFVMSNTWGDRSRDARIQEGFILEELAAAERLGVNVCQIDDGWQNGHSGNSAFSDGSMKELSGFYAKDAGFWEVNRERFPRDLQPVLSRAREAGVEISLWYAPDSDDDFVNWRKDAGRLLELHRRYGVSRFKLDGIKLQTKTGEKRLFRLMQQVVREAGGNIYFCLDATAGVRFGYLYKTQYGGIFLENRYTDWGKYYPHMTLRNLWMLCKYVPARKLQLEFLNVRRNRDKYAPSPLNPDACGAGYALGAVLFANPLVWMEMTGLEEGDAVLAGRILQAYRSFQRELLGGHVLPIGQEPSGTGWTGFQSALSRAEGYVQVVREYNESSAAYYSLYGAEGRRLCLMPLLTYGQQSGVAVFTGDAAGEKVLEPGAGGLYRFSLAEPMSWAIYRYAWLD